MKNLTISIIILLSSCGINTPTLNSLENKGNIFGTYISKPHSSGGSLFRIYSDSSYFYRSSFSLFESSDTGNFSMSRDTIHFRSFLSKTQFETSLDSNQKSPLEGQNFLIRNGRIYATREGEEFTRNHFWLKKGFETSLEELLDSSGNGDVLIYNGDGQVLKDGKFLNFKFIEGATYTYSSDGKIKKSEFYRDGVKIHDTILVK